MRTIGVYTTIFLFLLCLALSPSVRGQDSQTETEEIDWSDPETIDPFDEDIGDFLDVDLSAWKEKAFEAYQAGDYEEAAKYYLAFLKYEIEDGGSIYNLACCYGLLSEAELAAIYIERAVNAGFEDIDHMMWDPDFDNVRGTDVFDAAVDSIASMIEEREDDLGSIVHTDAPAFFECRVHLPEDYDPDRSYPLLVGLHGYGSNPDRFITLWERFESPNFIYASPRAPYPFKVGKDIGYSWGTWDPEDESVEERATEMSEDYIVGVVNDLTQRYNVDEVYLLGFSQGCAFAYTAGISNYGLLDGLICFGGWLDTEWLSEESIEAAADLRIFIAHGTEDRMVEYEVGIEARDTLTKYGYDVSFYEFDGAHSVPEEALQAVEEWMKR